MLDLSVISNVDDVIGALNDLEARHVPFAMSLTLNKLASEGQSEVRRRLADRFEIRQNWTARGIRTERATPRKLESRVFTLDWYMQQQQEGGTRRARHARHLAIPTLAVRKGETIGGRIKPRMRPAALKKKQDAGGEIRHTKTGKVRKRRSNRAPASFIAKLKGGKKGIFIRKFRARRLPVVLLYTLQDSVRLAPRWRFDQDIKRVSDKHMRRLFLESMHHALATDRKGSRKSAFVDHLLEHPNVRFNAGSVLSGLIR